MGILNKLFGNKKEEKIQVNVLDENIYNEREEKNPWQLSQEQRQEQNEMMDRREINRENQLKFVFRQLSCSNNYIEKEDIEAQINKQGYGNIELTDLDIEVLKRFNQYYKGKNLLQNEIDYLNEDPNRIVNLIEYTETCAKEQANSYGLKESEAISFIEVNGKIQELINLEQAKALEEQEYIEM